MPSSNAWVEPLGWMLIHSVWLLALIVAGAALVMACLRRRSAAARYVSGCVALTLSLATLPATLMWVVVNHADTPVAEMSGGDKSLALIDELRALNAAEIDDVIDAGNQAGQAQGLATLATAHAPAEIATVSIGDAARVSPVFDAKAVESAFWQRTESRLRPHLPVVVAVWLVGVVLLSSRPLIGWHSARRLQRVGLSEVSDSLKDMLSRLSVRLGLRRAVRLFQSSLVQIPCVVGAFKPVILLPASAISGLSPEQLEALLAHELAHIRRHDFAVNVIQTLVETLLFYHPAIWWLSRKVRQEREHCCDDLAISVCGDVAGYARMLVSVEGLRGRVPQTSVAASGGSLVERVRRLLPSPQEQTRSSWLAGIVVLGTLVVLVGSWQWTVGQVSNRPKEVVAEMQAVTNVSAPMTEQVENLPHKDWPQWGRSSHRNNVADGRLPIEWDLQKRTNVVWKAKLGTSTYSSPIVSGGKVFIGTNNGAALNPAHPKDKDMSCLVCFEQATGKLLWQYASEKLPAGRVHDWPMIGLCSTACADGDRVWVVTNRCELVCLDANGFRDGDNDGPFRDEATQTEIDADVVWKFDMFGELGVRPLHQSVSSITQVDGVLLLNTSNGPDESYVKIPAPNAPNFLALDAKTGRVIWTDNSAGESIVVGGSSCSCSGTSPAVATLGGVTQAIFAGREGWVYGYEFDDLKRGKTTLLWQFDCNPKTSKYFLGGRARRNTLVASPVIADGRVYVATGKNPEFGEGEADLWCIDPTKRGDLSTELVFNKSFENGEKPIPPKPLCACEVSKGDFVRPNPNAGAIWHYSSADRNGNGKVELEESFHCTLGNPVIHDGLLFIADFSGILHCFDSQTGEVQWTHDLLAATWSSCVIADGHILVGDEDGDLAIFKAARTKQSVDGDEPRNFESPIYSTPVVVDGTLFVATKNALVAIRDPKQAEQQVTKNEETRVVVVRGVVVDADGKPVPGAAVREASRARWRALVRPEWMVPGEVSEMRADAQGRFELRLARRWVPGAIIVAEPAVRVAGVERPPLLGMQRVSGEHDVRLPVPDLKVVVKESKPIDVFVSDREGKPVAGAQAGVIVTGWPLATGMTNADGRTTIPVPADVVMGNEVESVYAVKPNVGFNFRSFQWRRPRGEVGSVVSHKAEQVVRLELTGIKRVSVKVVEAPGDQPITGLSLYPWSFQKVGDSEIAVETIPDCWATTDKSGIATFDCVPEWNSNLLEILPVTNQFEHSRVVYANGDGQLTLRLARLVPISGRVTHADGRPAVGITIRASGDSFSLDTFLGETTTDADGRYRLLVAPNQIYLVSVIDSKWGASPRTGFAVQPNQPVEKLDFSLRRATRVFGRVTLEPTRSNRRSERGKPAIGYDVWISQYGVDLYHMLGTTLPNPEQSAKWVQPKTSHLAKTDADGRFELFLGPGEYSSPTSPRNVERKFVITDQAEIEVNFTVEPLSRFQFTAIVVAGDPPIPVRHALVEGVYADEDVPQEINLLTDVNGRADFERQPYPTVLHAINEAHSMGALAHVDAQSKTVTLTLRPFSTATGRILDANKTPLANRLVVCEIRVQKGTKEFRRLAPFRATTDANGRFALPRIIPGQQYHLRARTGEDTWQDIGTVTTKTEKTKDIGDLVLPPDQAADATKTAAAESQPAVKTITGRIVDDQDRPVAGARLWWVVTDWIPEGVIVNTASDEQGRFSISTPDVPPPRPSAVNDTLWVLKEGRQLATVPARNGLIVDGKDPGLVIRLEPATDTSFKVVSPDQKPVAGVVVEPLHFRMHMGYGIIPAEARKILSATTDAEGGVRMPSMPRKGFHSVHATSEAFGTQQVGLGSNPTPPAERTIELQPIGRIEGQLKADNPDWIRGVQLGFSTASQRIGTGLEFDGFALVTTDDQGRFVIPAIAAGSLTIYERAKNDSPVLPRLPASRMIVVGITEKLEITLESPVLVRGTIRTQDTDKPIPGAEISVRYGAESQGEQVISDAEGRYEARVLSGPVYTQVIVRPKEFSSYEQTGLSWDEKVDVRADATPFDLPPIRLSPTVPLKGKLIDQEGRPVAKVEINGLNGNRRYSFAKTNEMGEFSAQIPKTITFEGYQVWLDDDSAPITPTIDRPNPLILRVTVPRAADGATPK